MIRYLKTPRRGFALLALLGASLPAMAQDKPNIDSALDGYFTQSVNLVDVDTKGGASFEDAHMSTKLEHISSDANKFSYLTPKVGGLQVGVSFTPNNRDRNGGENNVATSYLEDGSHSDRLQEDIIEMALRFTGSYRGVGYRVSHSNVSSETLFGAIDPESNSTGLQVYWDNWVFGANLSEYKNFQAFPDDKYRDSANIETLNYALKYKQGNRYWGIGFTQSEESTVASSGDRTDYEEIMIGGGRKLMKGVEFGYYYQITEAELTKANAKTTAGTETLGLTLALAF